jgi:hypothetical protein
MVMAERSVCEGSTQVCIAISQQPVGHFHAQSEGAFVLPKLLKPKQALLEITDGLAFRVVRAVG